ncbi:MAG: hypothetical protein KJ970_09220 [Candidatus Eisenbacteria bacterium]|uniref:Polysaccharide chain length determinant N-terminal domain-containing protein n=1 Tax=Eiseniibacteriota bacterium TaxID=2212470 RepID=A0A948RU75_UNCEI|nr:hypothetical protein [Candidatus Eisenbacteria bacterium]MBU1949985.1 hypothetical protein [Candidatus Eisenbacteria bacterium]MBU2691098.1 hypothetical protein [Candidatus Eisenbacteria bacterium]
MTAQPSTTLPPRILRLLRWKRWILINTLIVAAGAVVVSLLLPEWYISTTCAFPPKREGAATSLLANDSGGDPLSMSLMASLLGGSAFDMPLFSSPSDIMVRILSSRPLKEKIIEKYDLMEHYKVRTMDEALRVFGGRVSVFVSREGFVTVAVEETDPQLAADMANDAMAMMDEIQRERRHSAAYTARVFTERRLAETRAWLAAAEDSLSLFQKQTGIVAPEEQATALVEVVAGMMGRRLALEVQLEALREIAGPTFPQVTRLTSEIEILDAAIEKMGMKASPEPSGPAASGSLTALSDQMLDYHRLLREVKIQETLHEYLITQHEFYRIQEVRDTPMTQILEVAKPAEKRSKPVRWIICAVSTLIAFGGSLTFFELLERLRDAALAGGTLSLLIEGVGGGFIIRKLRSPYTH